MVMPRYHILSQETNLTNRTLLEHTPSTNNRRERFWFDVLSPSYFTSLEECVYIETLSSCVEKRSFLKINEVN